MNCTKVNSDTAINSHYFFRFVMVIDVTNNKNEEMAKLPEKLFWIFFISPPEKQLVKSKFR
jgi:hypothetical protein